MKTVAIALCVILSLFLTVMSAIWITWPISRRIYLTNLALHEIGHRAAASEIGADGSRMQFFTVQDGQFFTGL